MILGATERTYFIVFCLKEHEHGMCCGAMEFSAKNMQFLCRFIRRRCGSAKRRNTVFSLQKLHINRNVAIV
jgi:hypothetical protein